MKTDSSNTFVDIEVEITPFPPKHGHLGFAAIQINKLFSVSGIAIFASKEGGVRLSYPRRELQNGTKMAIFRPLTNEVNRLIEASVAKKYYELLREMSETGYESEKKRSESQD